VARLVPVAARPTQRRIGIAAGQFKVPESIDLSNAELEHLFAGDPTP
jgi:antitoxin (DNA-binding transcriptional repressor) of toxin-antitoxin stability system